MFQVYKCSYCEFMGQDRMVEKHEKDCPHNPLNHSCHTCAHRKGWGFAKFGCQKNIEITEGMYNIHCESWSKDKTDWNDVAKEDSTVFDLIFNSYKGKE